MTATESARLMIRLIRMHGIDLCTISTGVTAGTAVIHRYTGLGAARPRGPSEKKRCAWGSFDRYISAGPRSDSTKHKTNGRWVALCVLEEENQHVANGLVSSCSESHGS